MRGIRSREALSCRPASRKRNTTAHVLPRLQADPGLNQQQDSGAANQDPVRLADCGRAGSTRLVKALRERYPRVLAEHRRLVRAAIAARGGREVDAQGDAFFAVFGAARQAVLCALDVQRVLTAHRWPSGAVVRVRIGVHTGQAVLAGEGYTGVAVHRAAR
ncbi:MAG TPA: adenylate/guanylate cyclase domain-containing protein, partial [Streptosporangiaceae bacterium]|nr:adenylate/guanylate cyclase domain-containing protein [Streptosporangiaceae bacterium]